MEWISLDKALLIILRSELSSVSKSRVGWFKRSTIITEDRLNETIALTVAISIHTQLNGIGSSRVSALPDMSRIIVLPELSFIGQWTDNSLLMSGSASAICDSDSFRRSYYAAFVWLASGKLAQWRAGRERRLAQVKSDSVRIYESIPRQLKASYLRSLFRIFDLISIGFGIFAMRY